MTYQVHNSEGADSEGAESEGAASEGAVSEGAYTVSGAPRTGRTGLPGVPRMEHTGGARVPRMGRTGHRKGSHAWDTPSSWLLALGSSEGAYTVSRGYEFGGRLCADSSVYDMHVRYSLGRAANGFIPDRTLTCQKSSFDGRIDSRTC